MKSSDRELLSTIVDNGAVCWITGTNVDVNSSADDVIAWYANSNQGFECIVVP